MSETILEEAQRLVHGDRQEDYGHPLHDFRRTAQIWSAILGMDVTPQQVGLCMVGVKLSRQVNKPKRDNLTDAAGYCETVHMIEEKLAEAVSELGDFSEQHSRELGSHFRVPDCRQKAG